MIDKFTEDAIEGTKKEITVETANQMKSFSGIAFNLIKPETIKFLSKINTLVDKYFTIPSNLPIGGNGLQNTPDMDDYEKKCKEEIAELEKVYKQQEVMMRQMKDELKFYEQQILEEVQIDMQMSEMFEENFKESKFKEDTIDNVVEILKDTSIRTSNNWKYKKIYKLCQKKKSKFGKINESKI